MSLARSLTSRMRARFEEVSANAAPMPNRAFSTKVAGASASKSIDRRLISLPTELVSTSNSLAYEAPDIKSLIEPPTSPRSPHHAPSQPLAPLVTKQEQQQQQQSPALTVSSSHSSLRSWEDGLASPYSPALTSASSVTSNEHSREPSPSSFDPHPMSKTFLLDRDQPETPAVVVDDKPAVPQRSSLHTKQSHTMLARARSQSRQASSRPASPRASADRVEPPAFVENRISTKSAESKHTSSDTSKLAPVARTSTASYASKKLSPDDHPFGAELAQVSELVEKYNLNDDGEPAIIDEETQYLIDNGFQCFAANEYMMEIQPLFLRAFGDSSLPVISEWI